MKRALIATAVAASSLATFVYASASRADAPPADASRASAPAVTGDRLAADLAQKLSFPIIPDGDEPYVGADAGLGFTWDIPDNWFQGGQFTYPLPWAPTIPGSGYEIVEQTPDFGVATSDEYFAYTFAWWLEGDMDITASQLSSDFTAYYNGLMDGCVYAIGPCNVANYTASFHQLVEIDPGPRALKTFLGEAQLYDEFVTGNLITLNMIANTYDCPRDGHRVVLFSAAPKPYTDPVWRELLARQAAFTCE